MNTFHLIISSPDGSLFDGEAVNLSVRAAGGDLAIMAGHMPFVTTLKPCKCKITLPDGTIKTGSAQGGILEVSDNTATLLSGSFHW